MTGVFLKGWKSGKKKFEEFGWFALLSSPGYGFHDSVATPGKPVKSIRNFQKVRICV
jgi:hypothetical protein